MTEHININNILLNSTLNNWSIILAVIPLTLGYYLQDSVFTRSIANVTSDIPKFADTVTLRKVLCVLAPYLIALLLFYISSYMSANSLPLIELETLKEVTNKMIDSVKTSKKSFDVNELMLHIKKICDTKNLYKIVVAYIVPTVIVAISMVYNFMHGDIKTGFIVLAIIIVLMAITITYEYNSINHAYDTEMSINDFYDEINEVIVNIDSVVTSDTKTKEMNNIDSVKDDAIEKYFASEVNNINTTYGLQFLSIISMVSINYLSYDLYTKKIIDAPILISTVLFSLLFMDYYNVTLSAIMELITSAGRLYETNDYFSKFIIQHDSENKHNLVVSKGNISLKNISLKYNDKFVFKNLNLEFKGGEITGLMGKIGSGKTSLLKILTGIINYQGEIYIDGQNMAQSSYVSIVRNIAYIPQHPKLFNKSVLYNVAYGTNKTESEIISLLDSLDLVKVFDTFPDKLNTIVGKEGGKLSGGQKQFVALTRAIVQNKKIILLDEPTSSLDDNSKRVLISVLKKIKNKTIIISTHDRQLIPIFNNVIHVDKLH